MNVSNQRLLAKYFIVVLVSMLFSSALPIEAQSKPVPFAAQSAELTLATHYVYGALLDFNGTRDCDLSRGISLFVPLKAQGSHRFWYDTGMLLLGSSGGYRYLFKQPYLGQDWFWGIYGAYDAYGKYDNPQLSSYRQNLGLELGSSRFGQVTVNFYGFVGLDKNALRHSKEQIRWTKGQTPIEIIDHRGASVHWASTPYISGMQAHLTFAYSQIQRRKAESFSPEGIIRFGSGVSLCLTKQMHLEVQYNFIDKYQSGVRVNLRLGDVVKTYFTQDRFQGRTHRPPHRAIPWYGGERGIQLQSLPTTASDVPLSSGAAQSRVPSPWVEDGGVNNMTPGAPIASQKDAPPQSTSKDAPRQSTSYGYSSAELTHAREVLPQSRGTSQIPTTPRIPSLPKLPTIDNGDVLGYARGDKLCCVYRLRVRAGSAQKGYDTGCSNVFELESLSPQNKLLAQFLLCDKPSSSVIVGTPLEAKAALINKIYHKHRVNITIYDNVTDMSDIWKAWLSKAKSYAEGALRTYLQRQEEKRRQEEQKRLYQEAKRQQEEKRRLYNEYWNTYQATQHQGSYGSAGAGGPLGGDNSLFEDGDGFSSAYRGFYGIPQEFPSMPGLYRSVPSKAQHKPAQSPHAESVPLAQATPQAFQRKDFQNTTPKEPEIPTETSFTAAKAAAFFRDTFKYLQHNGNARIKGIELKHIYAYTTSEWDKISRKLPSVYHPDQENDTEKKKILTKRFQTMKNAITCLTTARDARLEAL